MLLRYLRYLTVLASEKHFARAAAVCNITQPALSAGIVALERELNVRFVVPNRQYVSLTSEGEAVLPWAKRMLADHASLVQAAGVPSGTLTGHIRLGVISAAMPAIGPLTQAFCARHPAVTIGVHGMTSGAIRTGLTDAILDGGLTPLGAPIHTCCLSSVEAIKLIKLASTYMGFIFDRIWSYRWVS